ncbi:RodZ domain-containing protein [Sporosarcina sp. FSL K6-1522]|uniref:helix-turn-helix domain-containing protein n=1 Tax=Sporosarcina sp. FSL K6-1522 TaxID=2921554 RepID=UPI003159C460
MTGLGDRLKQARTAKGFTLDDLQSITKIQKRYLSGIEKEDYSMMPGSFYVRAFIKQYAEAVGVEPDEMLALYKDTSSAEKLEEDKVQPASPQMTRKRGLKSSNKLNEVMPKIIVALFIIVIIVVVWVLVQSTSSKKPVTDNIGTEKPITMDKQPVEPSTKPSEDAKESDADKEQGAATDDDNKDEPDAESEPDKVEQTLAHQSMNGETSTYTLTGAETIQLEIRTSADSWIGVTDSARVERMSGGARVMTAGEKVELDVSDTESVRIRVGRTASTEIYVNGELLKYATDRITQNIVIEYQKEQ